MIQGFFSILPFVVKQDKTLDDGAKILFSDITSLTHQKGYCWASNEYLAELRGVEPRTIKRWLHDLEAQGYIQIQTVRDGLRWDRKIFTFLYSQEMFTKGHPCPFERDADVPILREASNKKEESGGSPNPSNNKFESLQEPKMPPGKKNAAAIRFTKEEVWEEVASTMTQEQFELVWQKFSVRNSQAPIRNPVGFVLKVFKEDFEKKTCQGRSECEDASKSRLKAISDDLHRLAEKMRDFPIRIQRGMDVGQECVTFSWKEDDQHYAMPIYVWGDDFWDRVATQLRKMGFDGVLDFISSNLPTFKISSADK